MRTRAAVAVALALCCGLLQGCIILPVPVPRPSGPAASSRAEISRSLPEQLVAGQTSRTEVLLLLGEPDGRGDEDRWFTYGSRSGRGGVGWALFVAVGLGYGGGGSGAAKMGDWETTRRATIHFDSAGVVSAVDFAEKNCTTAHDALFNDNCLDAGGSELINAEDEKRAAEERAAQREAAGEVVARYDAFSWIDYAAPRCEGLRLVRSHNAGGTELLIAEDAILRSDKALKHGGQPDQVTQPYVVLEYAQIAEVRPVETHLLGKWIPIRTRSGSCVYLQLLKPRGSSPNDARALIEAQLNRSTARVD